MIENIKNIWIYDLEVFKEDWLCVAYCIHTNSWYYFHNDMKGINEWIVAAKPVLCGFNNKHYDDYIMLSILTNGGSNKQVKEHNDWIISGNQGFEFPPIKGCYKGNYFKSFDLKDDLPLDLSLKAIEGNIGANIKESDIPFDLDRKLTKAEFEETLRYCTSDVKNTYKLFQLRKNYLEAKLKVAKVGNIEPVLALGMTNPKLASYFLQATRLANPRDGELQYEAPKCLDLKKYSEALDFYKVIDYTKSLTIKAKDLDLVYGWGGLHGAISNLYFESSDDMVYEDADVGSYYPSMMIQLGYTPDAIPSAEGYKAIYENRLKAKHSGDADTADALKLVLNSTYGALKNEYNNLFQPKKANHICITGQLLLTDLIGKLEEVPTLKFCQVNTDGIMYGYNPAHRAEVHAIVDEWMDRTHMQMEYTEIHSCIQKDVNNYIMVQGKTYIDRHGNIQVTKEDKNKIAVKGSYVSLFKGGDFKNSSLVAVHKAIVEYFLHKTPVEVTIKQLEDIKDFQIIAKTGHTYDKCVHRIDGIDVDVNRCNRVYATSDEKYGSLYKVKGDRKDKIASIPEHCIIDNSGSDIALEAIDKSYYIELAKKRINDFLGNKETKPKAKKKGEKKMATRVKKEEPAKDPTQNVYCKLAMARAEMRTMPMKKTGKNFHIGYPYFSLDDIVPVAEAALASNDLIFLVNFNQEGTLATGTVVNIADPADTITFTTPCTILEPNKGSNSLQAIGSCHTYIRRYLYMLAMDIVEIDLYENTLTENGSPLAAGADTPVSEKKTETTEKQSAVPPTKEERKAIAEDLAKPSAAGATDAQKESIRNGLKKLQEADSAFNGYISTIVTEMKKGVSDARAEEIISEIGAKLYPEG